MDTQPKADLRTVEAKVGFVRMGVIRIARPNARLGSPSVTYQLEFP